MFLSHLNLLLSSKVIEIVTRGTCCSFGAPPVVVHRRHGVFDSAYVCLVSVAADVPSPCAFGLPNGLRRYSLVCGVACVLLVCVGIAVGFGRLSSAAAFLASSFPSRRGKSCLASVFALDVEIVS